MERVWEETINTRESEEGNGDTSKWKSKKMIWKTNDIKY